MEREQIQNKKMDQKIKLNLRKIDYKNLSFAYAEKKILNNLQLTIDKGRFVGIIGESGTGKTTLINILLGLLSPSRGQILADEINVQDNIEDWQKNWLYSSEVYLLDASIRENIAMGIDDKDINQKNR